MHKPRGEALVWVTGFRFGK